MSQNGDAAGEIRIHLFGRTDVGQIREHNEDNFLVADLTRRSRSLMEADRHQVVGPRGTVMGVCDGMGGAAAGEVASQLAVDIIYEKLVEGEPPNDRDELARRLVRSIEEAGLRIFNEARADRSRRGMGTTSTIAALVDSRLFLGQVGDSRAYILRGDRMVQVTRDQSLVNQLIEAGQLTEEEAETFEHNNIILQALGTADTVQVDLTYADLRQGDVLMLCSDGLSGMLRADEMREVMLTVKDPLEACKVLTDRANLAGGHDNITVIVAKFEGSGLPPASPDDVLSYQKYAITNQPTADATVRAAPVAPEVPLQLSDEAARESRKLKVSHTMVGMDAATVQAAVQAANHPETPHAPPMPPAFYDPEEDPVDIPTTGLPPTVVGMMVLGALLVAALAGGYLALAP
ncbi:MAG: serine/threonine-protein phosphatase [Myxococcales bacterium]|nr:serine/threonine-protein phosphatase [Myxococcales bacterium]